MWDFVLEVHDWVFLDYEKSMNWWKQPIIGKLYHVAAIMTSVKISVTAKEHDCYGDLIANEFGVSTPSLHP